MDVEDEVEDEKYIQEVNERVARIRNASIRNPEEILKAEQMKEEIERTKNVARMRRREKETASQFDLAYDVKTRREEELEKIDMEHMLNSETTFIS